MLFIWLGCYPFLQMAAWNLEDVEDDIASATLSGSDVMLALS